MLPELHAYLKLIASETAYIAGEHGAKILWLAEMAMDEVCEAETGLHNMATSSQIRIIENAYTYRQQSD